ncbi:hypothetical protein LTR84_010285 [Exophiala bonariae]|uniref:RTA1 domain protein n=1 Tax=Exophiala bonariae TaxID=1690606 RepID=A0AAV9MTI3_9EURO|nr:hypothetical protein LTR84_010285 [Exophiala bonariae]
MSTTSANTTLIPWHDCRSLSPQCPVASSTYGYAPSFGGNTYFIALFSACGITQVSCGFRYKTWAYQLAMVLACIDQAIGYAGRLMLHNNAFDRSGFQIQIICLVLGPAFNSAALYLVLKHIVLTFGPEASKIRPDWYTWIFITGDLISLIIQALDGSFSATAGGDRHRQDLAESFVIAGVSFQVVTLFFFAVATVWYAHRRRCTKYMVLSTEAQMFLKDSKFRMFIFGFVAAFVFIFIRCVFRIFEMAGGWRNEIMRNEVAFMVLDWCMICVATVIQTVLHPGYCFPRLNSGYVVPTNSNHHVERNLAFEVSDATEPK